MAAFFYGLRVDACAVNDGSIAGLEAGVENQP